MTTKSIAALTALALLAPLPASAVESTLQLQLSTDQDFERRTITYDCGAETPIQVIYLNAVPNFLAVVPIADEPQPLVFVSVVSASGVRYVSGHWVWWTKGPEATLHDATLSDDAEPLLTCSEFNDTP
jgi:membrane-bound inhibitor of C-type lysozyme